MIILGGFPTGVVFGQHGVTPAQIALGGNALSPLANDVAAGDEATELLWRLEPTYLAAGTTSVTDAGIYQLENAPSGAHTQPYRLFALPSSGAPVTSTSTIATAVGVTASAPAIAGHPLPLTVIENNQASFSVTATGLTPGYQWQRNGSPILGATSSTYTFTAALANNGDLYRVVASNSFGTATSNAAALTVNAVPVAPAIITQPQPQTVADGAPATFAVVASGTAPLSYQWRRNGASIGGAISSSYALATARLVDSGAALSVVISNTAGSVISDAAVLTVQPASANFTTRQELTSKASGEAKLYTFDFLSSLLPLESLTSASFAVAVYSGTDTTPSTVYSSLSLVGRSQVVTLLGGGEPGVIYTVTCTATSNFSNIYRIIGLLPMLEAL